MRRLITVWFVTPSQKVLLKEKIINKKVFLLPFEAWVKRRKSIQSTLRKINEEFQDFIPPGKYKVRFTEIEREKIFTKFGEGQRINFLCKLPFEPFVSEEIIIVSRENFQEIRDKMLKKDYERLLKILGIQTTLVL